MKRQTYQIVISDGVIIDKQDRKYGVSVRLIKGRTYWEQVSEPVGCHQGNLYRQVQCLLNSSPFDENYASIRDGSIPRTLMHSLQGLISRHNRKFCPRGNPSNPSRGELRIKDALRILRARKR